MLSNFSAVSSICTTMTPFFKQCKDGLHMTSSKGDFESGFLRLHELHTKLAGNVDREACLMVVLKLAKVKRCLFSDLKVTLSETHHAA